jgi:hypothetical protein
MGAIWIAWVGMGRCWWLWFGYGYKFEGKCWALVDYSHQWLSVVRPLMVWWGVDLKNETIKACVHQRLDYILKSYEIILTPYACYKLVDCLRAFTSYRNLWPKMIVWFICIIINLRLKVKCYHVKLSSSRSLSTPQLWRAFWSNCCFTF